MSRSIALVAIALPLVLGASCTRRNVDRQPQTSDLKEAVAVASAELARRVESPADYKLIRAQQTYTPKKWIWFIAFKPKSLLPDDTSRMIGAGGEVFVQVDLETKGTVVTWGE